MRTKQEMLDNGSFESLKNLLAQAYQTACNSTDTCDPDASAAQSACGYKLEYSFDPFK